MSFSPNAYAMTADDLLKPFPISKPAALSQSTNEPRSLPTTSRAQRQYLQAQVETASPTRLIILLYDGAIRFCSLAMDAMKRKNLHEQNENLIKAQRILSELMGSLDQKVGGEVSENLLRLYTFMLDSLIRANMEDDPATVQSVMQMLTELRETWEEVDRITHQTGGA